MNFEEIITEHNDKLVAIFTNAGESETNAISHFVTVAAKVDSLNKETEARISEIFDKSFLESNAILENKDK